MNEIVNADMSEFWNGVGSEKWLRFQEAMDANLRPFGQKAMAAAALSSGEAVLDIGCGCGDTSFEMARKIDPEGRILGVDISAPILERAKDRAMSLAGKTIEFDCGDAQVHRFEAASFDVVFSRFGVMFFDDPVAAFKNMRRALRADGRLAFICWQPLTENEWVEKPLDLVSSFVPRPAPMAPDAPGPLSFGDPDRVKRILTKAGFKDVKINGFRSPFTVGRDVDEAVLFLTQMGPAGTAIAQSEADEALKSHIAEELREFALQYVTDNGVKMGSSTWIVSARNS